jgi:hypothetical protein
MIWSATTIVVLGGCAALLITGVVSRLKRYWPKPAEGASGFSVLRYEPMERLLLEEDVRFLESQPGYTSAIGEQFKRDGRRIFRLYLEELAQDFHRLHAEARNAVARSSEQHAELVGVLIRQQARFWFAIASVEMRLLLGPVWISKQQIHGLTQAIDAMRIDLARFVPAPAA